MLKNIASTIYSIYALIVFIPISLVVFILYVIVFGIIPQPKSSRIAHRISQAWAHVTYFVLFIRVKIKNKHLIPKDEGVVFISNHRSLLDVPLWAISTPHVVKYLSKEEMTKVPVFGYAIKRMYITVNRADSKDRHLSIIKMVNALKAGTSIYLAPEGTRNKTKEILLPFKDGAFRMAIAAQAPICVFTLYNTDKLLNPKKLLSLLPGTIRGTWAEPIYTKGMTENDIPALREKVRNIMETNYVMMSKL